MAMVSDGRLAAGVRASVIAGVVCVMWGSGPAVATDCYEWRALGTGMDQSASPFLTPSVYSLIVYNGDLIAGGGFTRAGGQPCTNLARWDGTSWSCPMSFFGDPFAMTVYDGDLIVAGSAASIRGWDGSSAYSLGSVNDTVRALAVHAGDLVAGGSFTFIGGTVANGVARWDGTAWTAMDAGMSASPRSLAVYDSQLFAGGALGDPAMRIAQWDGASWVSVGGGIDDGHVRDMVVFDNELIAAGQFTEIGTQPATSIAAWNGERWRPLGAGPVQATVVSLAAHEGDLYIAGSFTGGVVRDLARWDGAAWHQAYWNSAPRPMALVSHGDKLVAGGGFTTAGGVGANAIAMNSRCRLGPPRNARWVRQFRSWGNERPGAAASDGQGGFFAAGTTTGNFGGTFAGGRDAWIGRYDAQGNNLWLRQFGTVGAENVESAAPDGAGGVFVGGTTSGDLVVPASGFVDGWIAHYDEQGERSWIIQLGSGNRVYVTGLAADGTGGIFAAGYTVGNFGGEPIGEQNIWLGRFDAGGNQTWIRQFGSGKRDGAYAMALDGQGGIYLAGSTTGDLGGVNTNGADAWVGRFDALGNELWIRQFGASSVDLAYVLAADGEGGVYIGGRTQGELGGPHAGGSDVWLARYDREGDQLWIRQFGSSSWDQVNDMAWDSTGGVWLAGGTPGELAAPPSGAYDGWLARYDSGGSQTQLEQFGTSGRDSTASLLPASGGGLFIVGNTTGRLGITSSGDEDLWLARVTAACYANCDGSTSEPILTVDDFTCFINSFAQAQTLPPAQQIEHYANCDGSTTEPVLTVDDFTCFINAFAQGCS